MHIATGRATVTWAVRARRLDRQEPPLHLRHMAKIDTMAAGGKPLTLDDQDILTVHGGTLTLNRGGGGSAVKGAGVQTRSRGFIDLDPLAIGGLLEQLKALGHW